MEASFNASPFSLRFASPYPMSPAPPPPLPSPWRAWRPPNLKASIRSPPPGFDYKAEMLQDSRSAVVVAHPELADLVEDGALVIVDKSRFGPVPSWRAEFVEPEAIWLLGTSHLSEKSASDVERVARAVRPDNVVVELCRSRIWPTIAPENHHNSLVFSSLTIHQKTGETPTSSPLRQRLHHLLFQCCSLRLSFPAATASMGGVHGVQKSIFFFASELENDSIAGCGVGVEAPDWEVFSNSGQRSSFATSASICPSRQLPRGRDCSRSGCPAALASGPLKSSLQNSMRIDPAQVGSNLTRN